MKTLYINIPDEVKRSGVGIICKKLGADIREIGRENADKTLLSIISGGKYDMNAGVPEKKNDGIQNIKRTDGGDLPEFIIFGEFDDDSLQEFLKAYKESGLERIPLKAVITPYNISWTLRELIEQLKQENRTAYSIECKNSL